MLSDKVLKSVEDAKKYFLEQDNYYLKDSPEWKEASRWLGKGAEKLGLSGSINTDIFEQLLKGKLPDGTELGKKEKDGKLNHRPGWDLTFSAPKSLSILAEVGQDKRIYAAHDKAVEVALSYIERACAGMRVTVGGTTKFENTHNLIAASFRHDTSRELDPQLHTHCVVMNATERKDGQWRSQASDKFGYKEGGKGFIERVRKNKIYFGTLYRSELAYEITQLGYDIIKTHADGRFEVAGVPESVIKHFSARRQEIEKFLDEKGWTGARASAFAALETRDEKKPIDREILHAEWLQRSNTLGFDVKHFIEQSKSLKINSQADLPSENAQLPSILNDVIENLSEFDVRLSHHKILNRAVEETLGTATSKEIMAAMEQAVKEGRLIPLEGTQPELFYTTPSLIKIEESLLTTVAYHQYSVFPLLPALKVMESVNSRADLSGEQKDAILNVLTSQDRFVAINGVAGSGKSRVLSEVAKTLTQHKCSVICLTQTKARAQFYQERGIVAETLSGFLLKVDGKTAKKQDMILVDHAEHISAKQFQKLFGYIQQTNSRSIIACDTRGYLSFSSGTPIEQMIKNGLKTSTLVEIQRMISDSSKKAIQETLQGNIKNAFEKIGHRFIEIENKEERLKSIAKHYVSLSPQERAATSLFMPSQKECSSINEMIRDQLKQNKEIAWEGHQVMVLSPHFMSELDLKSAKKHKAGTYLQFYKNIPSFNIKKGDYCLIEEVDGKKNTLMLKRNNGACLEMDLRHALFKKSGVMSVFAVQKKEMVVGDQIIFTRGIRATNIISGDSVSVRKINHRFMEVENTAGKTLKLYLNDLNNIHFDYAYSTTSKKGRYRISKNIIAHQSSDSFQIDQRVFYKNLSQATDHIWLYIDNKEQYLKQLSLRTGNKIAAIDALLIGEIEKEKNMQLIVDPEKLLPEQMRLLQLHIQKTIMQLQKNHRDKYSDDVEKMALNAVNYARMNLSERNAAFTHKELLSMAVKHVLGKVPPGKIESAISQLEENGELLQGFYRSEGTLWTTKEAIQNEEELLRVIKDNKNKMHPITAPEEVDKRLSETLLNQGQKEAAKTLLTTKDRFTLLQAAAGSGKTTLMEPVKPLVETAGLTFRGIAPSHTAVEELNARGIPSQTLQSFLIEAQQHNGRSEVPDFSHVFFILDEASMVSTKDCLDYVKYIAKTGARSVESGDAMQLLSPNAGNPFELQQKSAALTLKLTEIMRQDKSKEKLVQAVDQIIHKNYAGALHSLDNQVKLNEIPFELSEQNHRGRNHQTEPPGIIEVEELHERLQRMADNFLSRDEPTRKNTVVIVPLNEHRVIVNTLIREGLQLEGKIGETGQRYSVMVPKHLNAIEVTQAYHFKAGDFLRINRHIGGLNIKKGSYLKVQSVNDMDNLLTLETADGKTIFLQPNRLNSSQRGGIEVYKKEERELAAGDEIRLTRSDKKQNFFSSMRGEVINATKDKIIFKLKNGEMRTLTSENPVFLHWDYNYAVTAFGAQGKTINEVITHEDSRYRTTNQRSLYVEITRAKKQVTLYTNNKKKLIEKIQRETGDKLMAFEVVGALKEEHGSIDKKIEKKNVSAQKAKKIPSIKQWEAKDIQYRLKESAEAIIEKLLGAPLKKSASEWRYGSKQGSLVFTLKGKSRGLWYDHQAGEGGDLLKLIAKQHGMSLKENFKKVLETAAHLLGLADSLKKELTPFDKKDKLSLKQIKIENDESFSEQQKKSIEKAKKLFAESYLISGTLAERYLREHRGITKQLPDSLRYHPRIYSHRNGGTYPALLIIAKNDKNEVQAVQAIYLDKSTAHKADVEVKKQSFGVIKRSCVTLQTGKNMDNKILFCEGVETGLSLCEADLDKTVKAVLGVSNFKNIPIQPQGKEVIFCLDNDGDNKGTQKLIREACEKQHAVGNTVYTNMPAKIKADYNDVLKEQGASAIKYYIDHSVRYDPPINPELRQASRLDNTKNREKDFLHDSRHINFADRNANEKLSHKSSRDHFEQQASEIRSYEISKNKSYNIEQEL
ncbi:MAG: traI [Gammaproteobacteria bacterium]|jgi:conjugative transfer relaxase protein TraI|nr:traI [Gammaproteobacteria bacterium]